MTVRKGRSNKEGERRGGGFRKSEKKLRGQGGGNMMASRKFVHWLARMEKYKRLGNGNSAC